MPTETTLRAQQLHPGAPDEADYHAFCTALSESARGRAFLAEYARRNRNTETRPLLSAIERLQISLAIDPATPAEVLVKQKLRALLDDITTAQNEIEASVMAIRTAKLADLIAMVEQRLVEIMARPTSSPAPIEPSPPPPPPPEQPAEDARAHLAVVPPSDQPELPIPSPAAQPPPIALVRTEVAIEEVVFADEPKAAPPAPAAAPPIPPKAPMPTDPLAEIRMLSEEERLALFT